MTQQGFVAIPNWLIREPSVPPNAKVLYGVMLSYAFGKAGECTAGTQRMCDEAGISRASFFRSIAVLLERDYIEVRKVRSPSGWRNTYAPKVRAVLVEDFEGSSQNETTRGVVSQGDGGSSQREPHKKTKTEEHLIPEGSRLKESTRESNTRTFGNRGGSR
jgi:hypothetical protein